MKNLFTIKQKIRDKLFDVSDNSEQLMRVGMELSLKNNIDRELKDRILKIAQNLINAENEMKETIRKL